MSGIINGITWFIDAIKMIFDIIMNFFDTIGMVFRYLFTIVQIAFTTITTLPSWLQAFALITVSISIAYFLIGRSAGKSD